MLRTRTRNPVQPAPTWDESPPGPPRVLVEHADRGARDLLASGLRSRGYDVLTCAGPADVTRTTWSECPLLRAASCPAVDGADVVLSCLRLGGLEERLIVRTMAGLPGAPPIILEATEWQLNRTFGDSPRPIRLFPLTTIDQVASSIERAIA